MVHAEHRLNALSRDTLKRLLRGIEKESLRIRPDGTLAITPHPPQLGAALTHPHITTDFSESQMELITGVQPDVNACLAELTEIHQFVYRHIGDDALWSSSMPCRLPADDDIPIGRYGASNVGRLKTVYRAGLARRYGPRMQTISGVHYNFSLPEDAMRELQAAASDDRAPSEFRTERYFALIRNFRRHSWLPLYLFGASPAVGRSFVEGRPHRLQALSADTLYLPHATSLRMGPLGYQSDAQMSLAVSYNCLRNYAGSLHHALTEPYPPYEAIGVQDGDGHYRQLATTLLQIENEFYGTIRPKRRIRRGERPLHALTERGVEYVEVRSLDVDPFSPAGIDPVTMRFLDVFLLHCLLTHSPPDTREEIGVIAQNQYRAAERGREPGVRLQRDGVETALAEWGIEVLRDCAPIAAVLDEATRGRAHGDALAVADERLRDPERTPSARVLAEMRGRFDNSHIDFALAYSMQHRAEVLALPLSDATAVRLQRMADESLAVQRTIEAADSVPFEAYRRQYLAQDLMSGMPT
ncbi:MAG TPA: glutamate--cysteine ligase [Casimicrobiaceae bacterium]|nr:glutamate--cysteine ligase [Casimicrobiaceae bacterium]